MSITVEGLAELRAALHGADKAHLEASLRTAHDHVADDILAKIRAATGTRQQEAAIAAVVGGGTATGAEIGVAGTVPFGLGAYLGALGYRQFPAWVGDSWDAETGAGGPYVVGPAVAASVPDIVDAQQRAIAEALTAAGLDVT